MKTSMLFTLPILVLVGCATTDQYDIRPDADTDGIPTAVAWQNQNDAALAEATRPEALSALVSSDAAADALLAQLKGAYATDPVVMTQIGCVTQLVLCPKCKNAAECRRIWVSALRRRMAETHDDYIKTFCQQQLWLCAELE